MDILWLIDTENFDAIETKFYGWTVSEKNELLLNQFPSVCDGTGSYTYVKKYQHVIEIGQDFLGTQSIFVYKGDGFGAASNSFMRLVKHLVEKGVHLTLNKTFMIQYMYSNEEPMTFDQTLVNEILVVPNQFTVYFGKDGKMVHQKTDYHINEYTMDDENGLSIIDKWYEKWIEVYRNIAKSDYNVLLDLSGGFDSRISFSIFNNANIDKDRVIMRCTKPGESKYEKSQEDWEISREILKTYKYTRINDDFYNEEVLPEVHFNDYEDVMFGNSKVCDYDTPHFDKPFIHITGDYGGRVHGSFPFSLSGWSDHVARNVLPFFKCQDNYDTFLRENARCIVMAKKIYGIEDDEKNLGDFLNLIYKRFYGKKMSLKMIHNDIYISPFMDPLIHTLKNKSSRSEVKYQLASLILIRHATNLINYRFQGNRKLSDETKKELYKISCRYPYQKKEYEFIPNKEIPWNKCVKYDFGKTVRTLSKLVKESHDMIVNEFTEDFYKVCEEQFLDYSKINSQNFFTPMISLITVMNLINK